MTPSEAIRKLLDQTGATQVQLAKQIGLKGQSSISSRLSRGQMNMSTFMLMLGAFGYEIVVRPRGSTDPSEEMIIE